MLYKIIRGTPFDDVFSSFQSNLIEEDLLSLGFMRLDLNKMNQNGGSYSQSIFIHNEKKLLIKEFKTSKYETNLLYSDYRDYCLLEKAQNSKIKGLPTLFGYSPKKYMVVEYLGDRILFDHRPYVLNTEEAILLMKYLFTTLKDVIENTHIFIEDIQPWNIAVTNKGFVLFDFSTVNIFSSIYYAKITLLDRIQQFFIHLLKTKKISKETFDKIFSQIKSLYNDDFQYL